MNYRTEQIRGAITRAALSTFCTRGYGVATLEEIGAQVGLTRAGVLHHFRSKGELLAAVVEPYRTALADLLSRARADDPPTQSQRHELLTSVTDLLLEHRAVLRLLANDVSARVQLGLGDQWPSPQGRLLSLLVGTKPTDLTQLRVTAALGAMIHPVTSLWLDLEDSGTRSELVDVAAVIIDGPRPAASVVSR